MHAGASCACLLVVSSVMRCLKLIEKRRFDLLALKLTEAQGLYERLCIAIIKVEQRAAAQAAARDTCSLKSEQ